MYYPDFTLFDRLAAGGAQAVPVMRELVLDTDEERFAGHTRLAPGQRFHSHPAGHGGHEIKVYLPARCALILRLINSSPPESGTIAD